MSLRHALHCVSILWIIVTLECVSSGGESENYIGCYKDEGNPRAFAGHVEHFGTNLTPEKCNELCYRKGFLYSATQGRSYCFCNDNHPNPNSKGSEDRCSKPCSGNSVLKCGDEASLSVRKTGISDYSEITQYMGCYYNVYGLLNDVSFKFDKTNSPRRCMNVCLQLGHRFAGVQNSRECYCGNQEPSEENIVDGDECNWPCSGNDHVSCGGKGRLAIYTTTIAEVTGPPKKKRFYVENEKKADWYEALMACLRNNTRLATIDNVQELDEIKGIIRQLGRRLGQYWTSGSDIGSEGNFIWATNGKKISSTSDWWLIESHHRQPDNWEGNENCVEVWERFQWQGYGLNDRPCSNKDYYICESYAG